MDSFIEYIKGNESKLLSKTGLIRLFTHQRTRPVYSQLSEKERASYPEGTIFFTTPPKDIDASTYGYIRDGEFLQLVPSKWNPSAPFCQADPIKIQTGDIANYIGPSLDTIIGCFIANYVMLASVIKNASVPYVKETWNIRKIEKILSNLVLENKITVAQYLQYIEQGTKLAHCGEIFQPTMSERSIMVPKSILKRRDELIKEAGTTITDPVVASAIEKEVVALYKEYIGNDPVAGYMESSKKSYNVHAKNMFLFIGAVSDFGGDATDIQIVPKSLSEGMSVENFAIQANSIRKGSYARGVETQEGGALTKWITRVFQDVRLIPGDCGSKQGETLTFDKVIPPTSFIGRYVISGNSLTRITTDNVKSFEGKTVILRSPRFCNQPDGLCTTCMGEIFKTLEITSPGQLAIAPTSAMMGAMMSAMHVESLEVLPIDFDIAIV